jgi:RNA polymerase sigma factor (sigma-70 family)
MTTLASRSDQELWNLFKAGDDKAYEQIYKNHSATLFRYGYQISKDKALVEDCVHDLFTYLFLHRSTLGETTSIRYYLLKSLRRKIVEVIQRKNRTDQHHLTAYRNQGNTTVSFEENLIEEESSQIRSKNLERVIQELPPRQQEAIFLLYFSALSYEEIAAVMSLSVRTVYNHVHSGIETLRSKMLQPELAQLFLAYLSASLLPFNTF